MGNHAEAATRSGHAGPCKTTLGGITSNPFLHFGLFVLQEVVEIFCLFFLKL